MRYMQMIKRCKLPIKKATQEVEAQSEEQAKRCKLTAAGEHLRASSAPSWEDRLGHLHTSTVARLLVEGKLPTDSTSSSSSSSSSCSPTSSPLGADSGGGNTAMDLSSKSSNSVLDKARNFHRDEYRLNTDSLDLLEETADRIRHQMQAEMENLKTRSASNEVRFGGWKCRYCPYSCSTSKKLYSHYQFHQQLLTSHSSKPHMEWLAAYRQAKEDNNQNIIPSSQQSSPTTTTTTNTTIVTSSTNLDHKATSANLSPNKDADVKGVSFPSGGLPIALLDDKDRLQAMRESGLSLRYLLSGNGRIAVKQSTTSSSVSTTKEGAVGGGGGQGQGQGSASGCLRSIVQAVMQQGACGTKTSVTATSVYASMVNARESGGNGSSCDVSETKDSSIMSGNIGASGHNENDLVDRNHLLAKDQRNAQQTTTVPLIKPKAIKAERHPPFAEIYHRADHLGSSSTLDHALGQRNTNNYNSSSSNNIPGRTSPEEVSDSLTRRLVTIEREDHRSPRTHLPPAAAMPTLPPRPTSRESTSSSFSSSGASLNEEINVDDSAPSSHYGYRRRIDSVASDFSDASTVARGASRKRTRSIESNTSAGSFPTQGSQQQQQQQQQQQYFRYDSYTICNDPSCSRTEDIERVPAAKAPCLDFTNCRHSSYLQQQQQQQHSVQGEIRNEGNTSHTTDLSISNNNNNNNNISNKLRQHSPTNAVISSTGTPPPSSDNSSTGGRHGNDDDLDDDLDDDESNTIIDVTTFHTVTKDRSVQCELLVPPRNELLVPPTNEQWKRVQLVGPDGAMMHVLHPNGINQNHSADVTYVERSHRDPSFPPAMIGSVKCPHCGIVFDDSVLHSIHMGCHSHCDPFQCNVCGEQCGNKYGFYTHIMRGHHKR